MQRQLGRWKGLAFFLGIIFSLVSFSQSVSVAGSSGGYFLYVASVNDDNIIIIDSDTHKEIGRIDMGYSSNPVEIVPSHDRRFLYVTNRGADEIAVIETKSRTVKTRIKVGIHPHFLRVSPDGRYLVVANNQDYHASVIDLSSNKVTGKPEISRGSSGVAISADSKYAYIPSLYAGDIAIIDLEKMERVSIINGGPFPTAIVIPPNSHLAYLCTNKDRISILDTRTNKVTGHIPVGDTPAYITVTEDGRTAFVSNNYSNTVAIVDLQTRKVVKNIKEGFFPTASAMSPDGRFLFATNYGDGIKDGSISVIDASTLSEVDRIGSLNFPRGIAVVPAE